ncbi:MAG: bacillithiol system protein YtxJ [Granulosicoccus sp.]|jgi:bacillithiol system protein YtxJ
MNWKNLILEEALGTIVQESHNKPQLIFKHSTRCSISSMAKNRLERSWNLDNVEPWYLDLIAYRSVSNMIESQFKVQHESPQAILFVNGEVVYTSSHSSISVDDIKSHL